MFLFSYKLIITLLSTSNMCWWYEGRERVVERAELREKDAWKAAWKQQEMGQGIDTVEEEQQLRQ